jgi:hypothetical protein
MTRYRKSLRERVVVLLAVAALPSHVIWRATVTSTPCFILPCTIFIIHHSGSQIKRKDLERKKNINVRSKESVGLHKNCVDERK